jgi:hypothetical protein
MLKRFWFCVSPLLFLVLVFTLGSCHGKDVSSEDANDDEAISAEDPQAVSSEAASEDDSDTRPTSPESEEVKAPPKHRDSTSAAPTPVRPDTEARTTETPPAPEPEIIEVTIPVGTVFELELLTALDTSVNRSGDEIQARTISPVYLKGEPVLPQGTFIEGRVTEVQASGKVKGRARLAFTFDRLSTQAGVMNIKTSYVDKEAGSDKKKDATIIGGGAGVGALVGGILGGKKGAAIGAAIGGAGGTAVVLTTTGDEIKLPVGTEVNVRLDAPVTVRVN